MEGSVRVDLNEKLQEVCRQFKIEDTYVGYETVQMGNVNRTYKVNFLLRDGNPKSFLVQNVNTYAFRDPVGLMENIDKVTEHIRAKCPGKTALHFHHTHDRKTYLIDGENFWRMTNYIDSVTYNAVKDPQVLCNAGKAFGEFQMQLADFDIRLLHETIPGFHNTRQRYEKLAKAVEENAAGRLNQVQEELRYLTEIQNLACTLTDMYSRGELPLRVTHNDTKINNVLFAANYVEEDCPEYDRAGVDLEMFRTFAQGFLSQTAGTLTENEIRTLGMSCFCLTAELAVRFLDDYIRGDPYFKIQYPEHNLVRTRCQIALAKDMLRKMDQMDAIVRGCL